MKFYMRCDMEGISGIVSYEQVMKDTDDQIGHIHMENKYLGKNKVFVAYDGLEMEI